MTLRAQLVTPSGIGTTTPAFDNFFAWPQSSVGVQARSLTTTFDTFRQKMSTVQWLRLVQSLFQNLLGLALHVYILVLVRENNWIRYIAVTLNGVCMSLNVALKFGDKQPCAPLLLHASLTHSLVCSWAHIFSP